MGKMNKISMLVDELLAANPVIDPLVDTIEENHFSLAYDNFFENLGVDYTEPLDPVYDKLFMEDLLNNFDEYFLDDGIAVRTYEAFDGHNLSREDKRQIAERFQTIMIVEARKALSERITHRLAPYAEFSL